jgi:hypothetical protein
LLKVFVFKHSLLSSISRNFIAAIRASIVVRALVDISELVTYIAVWTFTAVPFLGRASVGAEE